jgi:2'-5' RNA ligase
MTGRWRCFVAAPISDELRTDLAAAVESWRERADAGGLRWTPTDHWHVTLAFLGAVEGSTVPDLLDRIAGVAVAHEPFSLRTGGLGAFPRPAAARVVWYRLYDAEERLASLARALADVLSLEPHDPFRPHVTLARARRGPTDARSLLAEVTPLATIVVRRLMLMRSQLDSGAPRYERLGTIELGGAAHG